MAASANSSPSATQWQHLISTGVTYTPRASSYYCSSVIWLCDEILICVSQTNLYAVCYFLQNLCWPARSLLFVAWRQMSTLATRVRANSVLLCVEWLAITETFLHTYFQLNAFKVLLQSFLTGFKVLMMANTLSVRQPMKSRLPSLVSVLCCNLTTETGCVLVLPFPIGCCIWVRIVDLLCCCLKA